MNFGPRAPDLSSAVRALTVVRRPQRAVTAMTLAVSLLGAGACAPAASSGSAAPAPRPTAPAAVDEAIAYMLSLINRDRAAHGLTAVELDPIASKGAERQARDMAAHGFTAHWGTDGSVPEQRYTEAGGTDMVQENVACLFDGVPRELDEAPRYDPALLEQLQKMFMDEVPPNDGHRKNILKPTHHRVGIGLAQPAAVNQPCLAQEFVDDWGDYSELPREAERNVKLDVSGEIREQLRFGGVGIGRIDLPRPKTAKELNATNVYRIPQPDTLYFPAGFKTPKPVQVDGQKFSIQVGLGAKPGPGRYEVSIWAKEPGKNELFMVSLRTIMVK